MKATMYSTDRVVTIAANGYPGNRTKARVWEGVTAEGVNFTAYIPQVQVCEQYDNKQFARELQEHKPPEPETLRAIDMRMLI